MTAQFIKINVGRFSNFFLRRTERFNCIVLRNIANQILILINILQDGVSKLLKLERDL